MIGASNTQISFMLNLSNPERNRRAPLNKRLVLTISFGALI